MPTRVCKCHYDWGFASKSPDHNTLHDDTLELATDLSVVERQGKIPMQAMPQLEARHCFGTWALVE